MSSPVMIESRSIVRSRSASGQALQVVADLVNHFGLPELMWYFDTDSVAIGTARGSYEDVTAAVQQWADVLGVKPSTVDPQAVVQDGWPVVDPGWVVVHARMFGVSMTVGGRLATLPEVAF